MADDMIRDTSAYHNVSLIPGTKPIDKTQKLQMLKSFQNKELFLHAHAPASMCSTTRYPSQQVDSLIDPISKTRSPHMDRIVR